MTSFIAKNALRMVIDGVEVVTALVLVEDRELEVEVRVERVV